MKLADTLATTMALCAMVGMAHAVDYRTEYVKKINASQDIGVLGDSLGGDRINLFTGTTEFSATDVSIPGNFALPVSVGRRYAVEPSRTLASTSLYTSAPILRAFGDWDLDIPYLTGTFSSTKGWEINSSTPSARCSVTSQTKADGSPASGEPRADVLYNFEFWHGNSVHLPGGGDQTMLVPFSTNTNRPTTGGMYHWTTNQSWWFSCLAATKNNAGGEAYIAVSPDGTKYTFDWLSSRPTSPATKNYLDGLGAQYNKVQLRKEFFMLPSQITDRFGNTVTFAYSSDAFAKLLSMTASDGRKITLTYNASGFVDTVSDGTRTWRYEYTSGRLTRVVLPDDSPSHPSAWQYAFAGLETMLAENGDVCTVNTSYYDCYGEPQMTLDYGVATGYLIHPSGARVDYTFAAQFHIGAYPGNTTYMMGLSQKAISGPGIPTATWSYSFSPNQMDGKAACMAGSCPTRIWTDALNPDGSMTRQLYNFDGQLLQVLQGEQTASGNSSPPIPHSLRGSDIDVADDVSPLTGSVPVFYRENDTTYTASPTHLGGGGAPLSAISRLFEYLAPEIARQTFLQGASFIRLVNSEDAAFRLPTSVTSTGSGMIGPSSSTTTYSKTMLTTYQHDLSKWVIGQVASESCSGGSDCTPAKEISRTDYDANDLPWRTYSFGVLQQTSAYDFTQADAFGAVKTVIDGRGNVVTLSSWKRGIPQLVQLPGSAPLSASVDNIGSISNVTDQLASQTCYGYDAIGRLNLITYNPETASPANACSTAAWTQTHRDFTAVASAEYGIPAGHWKQTVYTGNGRVTTYHDARWQPVLIVTEDTANASTRSFVVNRYDVLGRKSFTSYPVATLTSVNDALTGVRTSYDALGRVTQVQQDDGATPGAAVLTTATAYPTGFQTRVTNPRNYQTTTSYQAFDTPATDSPVSIGLPEGVWTTITRDVFGKPKSISRSGTWAGSSLGATRYYAYDANERLCKTINPESGAAIVDYDAAGNIAWSAEGQPYTASATSCDRTLVADADKTLRTYDALNRVTQVTTPGGVANVTTTYEPDGLVKSLSAAQPGGVSVLTEYFYNRRRLLTSENSSQPGWYLTTVGYSYDPNGHATSLLYPDMQQVSYAPDALGRPTQVGSYATGIGYYPNGAISGFTYGNGLVRTMTQNARRLPAVSLDKKPDNSVIAINDTISYDPDGNALGITDGVPGGVTSRSMTYDGLDRLITATSPGQWGTATYAYDPLDNPRSADIGGTAARQYRYNYGTTSNLLTDVKTPLGATVFGFAYDARGNQTLKGGQGYQFDIANRLTEVTGKENYRYDGLGRRVFAWSPPGTIMLWQYAQDGRELYASDARRSQNRTNIYLGNTVLATRTVDWGTGTVNVRYLHTDALGSPVAETGPTGAILKRNSYEPYGAAYGGTSIDGVGYTGHVMDQATGLTYMQQRYYDPAIGRFLSVDPAASEFNNYSYASNNPYRFTDPDGRMSRGADYGERASNEFDCRTRATSCFGRSDSLAFATGSSSSSTAPAHKPGCDTAECDEVKQTRSSMFKEKTGALKQAGEYGAEEGGKMVLSGYLGKLLGAIGPLGRVVKREAGPASEKAAVRIAKQVEQLAGKEARRDFHDAKVPGMGNRSLKELKSDAVEVLENWGVSREDIPSWLRD